MMDLDEAIQSFEDEMEKQTALGHSENIDNLEQMSEWLKELKAYRENTCGDVVSREAVQEEISKSIALKENPHQMYKRIQVMPSVTPQQRTGRWIKTDVGYKCSNCPLCTNLYGTQGYLYCPNCGAKMEVEE